MDNDFELFKGKKLSDIFEDIYKNQKMKKKRISDLIFEIRNKIRNINDWVTIGPLIKDLVDTSVRNDEALFKLATIAQRIMTSSSKSEDGGLLLSDAEKKELLAAVDEIAASHGNDSPDEIEELENEVNEAIKKMESHE